MYLTDLQCALVKHLRLRVSNGEFSERGLAKIIGTSQPHIHNVLKGKKILSVICGDRALKRLGLSVLDLIEPAQIDLWIQRRKSSGSTHSYVPVLDGVIGPGQVWPTRTRAGLRFPIDRSEIRRMTYPVAARLGDDPRMRSLFSSGDWVVLDQSMDRRTLVEDGVFYLVKSRGEALVRRLRRMGDSVFAVAEDSRYNPAGWEILSAPGGLGTVVVARVRFLAPESEWWDAGSES